MKQQGINPDSNIPVIEQVLKLLNLDNAAKAQHLDWHHDSKDVLISQLLDRINTLETRITHLEAGQTLHEMAAHYEIPAPAATSDAL